ncbi:MAG: hypothetical protein ACREDF_09790 [Thermoplasmata archaeon]
MQNPPEAGDGAPAERFRYNRALLLLAASRGRKLGPYVDRELGDIPVNFLSTGRTSAP